MRLDERARGALTRVRRIHFVGIGGAGMCGVAEILCRLGYEVSGSDTQPSNNIERLRQLKARIWIGHDAKYARGADLLVRSAAVADGNPELLAARRASIPIMQRAEMLAEIMRFGYGIAVAGAHGKTTTTSMLAHALAANDEDITFIVGGLVKSIGSNAYLGSGQYVVAEADESDASFLHLRPTAAIITNVDQEHLNGYGGDFEKVKSVFLEFLHNLPFYGLAVLCYEDEILRALATKAICPFITYGFGDGANYRARNIQLRGFATSFHVVFPDGEEQEVHIQAPGQHNVLNALACLALADQLHLARAKTCQGLQDFRGVARRQDFLGVFGDASLTNIKLVDDYGHHPREIEATLLALKQAHCGKRYVMIFQPHRYTRTRDLYDEFVRVLSAVDVLLLLPVYAAGEQPLHAADSPSLAQSIRRLGQLDPIYVADREELPQLMRTIVQSDDLVITQGAGDISALAQDLAQNNLYLDG